MHFEKGRVVSAACGDAKGDNAIRAIFAWPRAEFVYDPEAVLSDMPNVDRDLVAISTEMKPRAPAA